MRSASTQDRTETIVSALTSANCKSEMLVEKWDGTSWIYVEDLDGGNGININKSSKKYKYSNFSLTPAVSTCNFRVWNKSGKYSIGSGTAYDNFFDLDTKIRVRGGYKLPTAVAATAKALSLNNTNYTHKWYTKWNSSGYIEYDSTDAAAMGEDYFDFVLLGAVNYGSAHYACPYDIFSCDFFKAGYSTPTSIILSANGTDGDIYYRQTNFIDDKTTAWISGGDTVSGAKTITLAGLTSGYRFLQVMVKWDGLTYTSLAATTLHITGVTIGYTTDIEWIYYDVFYLDTPSYVEPQAPEMPYVDISARDAYKRAIENEINLESVNGTDLDAIIKSVCDKVGISYTATSIAELSSFSNRTLTGGLTESKTADDIFECCMQIINKHGYYYKMYMEYDADTYDNVLYVEARPSTYVSSYLFDYRNYLSVGAYRRNYDRLLKTITVINASQVVNAEVQLGTANYTTTGTKTISWSGDAAYKRFTVTTNTAGFTIAISDVTPTSAVFVITGSGGDVDITVYGNKWVSSPTYEGEYWNYNNMVGNKGVTALLINPLLISDTEAHDIAKGFTTSFGAPSLEANSIQYPYNNLLLEQNDMCMLWTRFLFQDNLYFITGLAIHWDETATDSSTFNLEDSGLNWSDLYTFDWDVDALDWDKGLLWDMDFAPNTNANDDTTVYKHNVDFS